MCFPTAVSAHWSSRDEAVVNLLGDLRRADPGSGEISVKRDWNSRPALRALEGAVGEGLESIRRSFAETQLLR
jgi:hypothetical protein